MLFTEDQMSFSAGAATTAHHFPSHHQHRYSSSESVSDAERRKPVFTAHRHQPPDYAPPPPPNLLPFSDVPIADILQLGPRDSYRHGATGSTSSADGNLSAPSPSAPGSRSHSDRPRKPTPGLAPGLAARLARLKALATARETKNTAQIQHEIGRLPEDQLRLLDQLHQANSVAGVPIERRGRPWKGPGPPTLLRSKSSRSSLRSRRSTATVEDDITTTTPATTKPDLLPEIAVAPPLDMDTNKYRLPDDSNENGTKVLPGTWREHVGLQEQGDDEVPPAPLPKDTPPGGTAPAEFGPDVASYFNPMGLHRTGSIYTISRASFANQLAQLTSLQLPDADSLSSKVSAIPTAQVATKALINAAEQIRMWISRASEVISGLDSDDDVEWAAAGGREGYEETENAITRFEELINVYVSAIEELQNRRDIAWVSGEDLTRAVMQMEAIMHEWAKIRTTLNTAKGQVETAMEWEELWNMVLGDIQNEMDELSRLVFEMEERRHKSLMSSSTEDGVDISDLQTIVEESPRSANLDNRFSMAGFPMSPASPATPSLSQDDSGLLALFARMQPLRASLDFLPMRLSVFEARAQQAFPTACEELEERRDTLEESYKKLQKDAESLRKELGEDRWVLVFRGAGQQAQKMYESVDRSMSKLWEAIDSGLHLTNPALTSKKIENYEAKKTHYGPAIERVLSIIEKGVKERLTVNGEILRLHTEMQSRWEDIKEQTRDLDLALDEVQGQRHGQALRDSVSSMLSNDRSTVGSAYGTPGSSPPSSVVMSGLGLGPRTPATNKKGRSSSVGSHLPKPVSARGGGLGPPMQIARKPVGSRVSNLSNTTKQATPPRSGSATPQGNGYPRAASAADNRARWNGSGTPRGSDSGRNSKPLGQNTPSPYSQRTPTPARSTSTSRDTTKIPLLRSPLGRVGSSSPLQPADTPSRTSNSRLGLRDHLASPGPYAQQTRQTSSRRSSMLPPRPHLAPPEVPQQRSASSMAASRRTTLLPQSQPRAESVAAGSRFPVRKAAEPKQPKDYKPRWHF